MGDTLLLKQWTLENEDRDHLGDGGRQSDNSDPKVTSLSRTSDIAVALGQVLDG
jgi:hypothetical protein